MTAPTQEPIRLRALREFQRHFLAIRVAAGFHNDVTHVYIDKRDFETILHNDAVNLTWGLDRSLRVRGRDRSLNVQSWESSVFAVAVLNGGDDPAATKARFCADVEKKFSTWPAYHLSEADTNKPLVQLLELSEITPVGDAQQLPRVKLLIEFVVAWKTVYGDPYTVA